MALTEISAGTPVFIDADIFIYHFAGQSEDCTAFLARVEKGDLHGMTDPTSILEVAHRLMMLEAIEHGISVTPIPLLDSRANPNWLSAYRSTTSHSWRSQDSGSKCCRSHRI